MRLLKDLHVLDWSNVLEIMTKQADPSEHSIFT